MTLNPAKKALLEILECYLRRTFNADQVYILLQTGQAGHVYLSAEQNGFALDDVPLLQSLLTKKKALYINDTSVNNHWHPLRFNEQPVRSWMGVPIIMQSEILGALWLESYTAGTFSQEQCDLLEKLGQFSGAIFRSCRLHREIRIAMQGKQFLTEAARQINSALDQPLILQISSQYAMTLFQADAACFVLYNDHKMLHITYQRNLPPDINPDEPLPPDDLLWQTVKDGTPWLLDNYPKHPLAKETWIKAGIKSAISVPLYIHGQVLGAFYLFRTRDREVFDATDLESLDLLGGQISTALQNARLFANERQRADELGALRDTLADFSAQLGLQDLMQAILRRAVALLLASGGELGLYEPEYGGLRVVACYNMGQSYEGNFIPIGQGVMGTVVQIGEILLIPDYGTWENQLPEYSQCSGRSVIAAPLRARGKLVGVISIVDKNTGRVFTENEIHILKTFTQQAAIAVDNAHLFEAANRRAEEAETLREVSLIVAGILDKDQAVQRILELLGRVVICDSAIVLLKEADALKVVGERQWTETPSFLEITFPIESDSPYSEVARSNAPLLLPDISERFPTWGKSHRPAMIKACMAVPLNAHNKVLGVLAVHSSNPRYFTQTKLRLLSAFASHVSIAIANAHLYQEAQHLAITDPLTKIYNRRYFFEIAQREFDRAVRYGYPLSILMLDIDHFKAVNDTYGHQIGDIALQNVANRCRESIRDIDILARYGGEEFIILLPNTKQQGALHVAHRIRDKISNVPTNVGEHGIPITVSIGVTTLSKETTTLDMLIGQADTMLYKAKEAGRNCVMPQDD